MSSSIVRYAWALGALGAAPWCAAGPVVFVNQALTTGANDGSSWSNAYYGSLGLQTALQAAAPGSGTQIWAAAGSYAPAPPGGDRGASFVLKNGVEVYGGFAGGETLLSQRDPIAHVTVLTGDLNSNDVDDWGAMTDNSVHVVSATNVDGTGVLDGFDIRRGRADAWQTTLGQDGAGVLIVGGGPRIAHCTFTGNYSDRSGAGIGVFSNSSPTIEACTFTGNDADSGIGVCVVADSHATVRSCSFVDAGGNFNSARGVGVSSGETRTGLPPGPCSVLIEDCEFSIQMEQFLAGDGVGVRIEAGTAEIRRSRFIRNSHGGSGGGVSCDGAAIIDRCVFIGNEGMFDGGAAIYGLAGAVSVTNTLFAGNDRKGFSTIFMQQGSVTLTNCTLAYNGAPTMTHFLLMGAHITLRNCVVWGNQTGQGNNPVASSSLSPDIRFDQCLVQGWAGQFAGVGTFAADPSFLDPVGADGLSGTEDDDLRPGAASPCIDRGDNGFVPAGLERDLAGRPRFIDIPQVADLGMGSAPLVDLGASEFACPADYNQDGFVDPLDYNQFINDFEAGSINADFNGDGFLNPLDYNGFINAFEAGC